MKYRTLYFSGKKLHVLDQSLLPNEIKYIECSTDHDVCTVIQRMNVRGAPAIGIAAAYGVVLIWNYLKYKNIKTWEDAIVDLGKYSQRLISARPTAVNLKWAVDRMIKYATEVTANTEYDPEYLYEKLLDQAFAIEDEDQKSCQRIGECGANLIKDGMHVMTYCNAGALATSGDGTALSPIYAAHKENKELVIYCCETRPVLQGARLTAWELKECGLNPVLICDNMAGQLMRAKKVDLVIVGADRIAANGDVVNKIGTYGLAVLARYHRIPFYVAAPASTFDLSISYGEIIQIETRHQNEVTYFRGIPVAPEGVVAHNPSFDMTPHELITGIISDFGLISPVNKETILEKHELHSK